MATTSIRKLFWAGSSHHVAALLALAIFQSCTAMAAENQALADAGPLNRRLPLILSTQLARAATAGYTERLLEVDIDGQKLNETVLVLEDKAGEFYLLGEDLQRWRFRPPAASAAILYQGQKYYPFSAISGVSHVYDPQKQTLTLVVRSQAFKETSRTVQYTNLTPPVRSGSGGFINYDLFAARSAQSIQRSGQFELGYFNALGVGTSRLLAGNFGSNSYMTRLDTTWTIDNPEKMQTLRLGDAINTPGAWGRSVRFGGIQFGTNFGTQPGLLTYPQQSVVGQATLPSTVDVFINNALVSSQNIPPGPFQIRNLPVVSGAGTIRLVVRDLLGREQVVDQPFYASQTLLRKGLDNFSYEFGVVRNNFGVDSNNYRNWLGSGTYRRGLSDRLTAELHAEVMHDQQTGGVGGDYLIPTIGTLSAYSAVSQSALGRGDLVLLGINRLSDPWSVGARTQVISSGFLQVGQQSLQLPPARITSANLSYAMGRLGSVGVAYANQLNRGQLDARIATLSYSVSVGKLGSFSISALRDMAGNTGTTIFAMYNIALSASTSASLGVQSMQGGSAMNHDNLAATLQRNLPTGEGYGYRLQARSDGSGEGSYSLQNNVGTYRVEAAQSQGSTAMRLNASGGIAMFGGDTFLSRPIDQSFAVVRISDYPNVRVLADNQLVGRTNSKGNALVPRLRAYDRNVISIDQRDLPLDANISALKLEITPYFRSGVEAKFAIEHARGATFTIHLEDGTPIPVGAVVRKVGKDDSYTVGYDGEVYVAGLSLTTQLRATWDLQSCEFELRFTASADPLPDLGIVICKGVDP